MMCTICHELLTHEEANYARDDWYNEDPMCAECCPSEWREIEGLNFLDDIDEEDDE